MSANHDPVRIALVGLGAHGRTIQQAVEEAGCFEVTAVYDVNDEEARFAAERFGCDIAISYEELLAREDLEAVALVTPNHVHRDQAEAAFQAGRHVFVEKPIANTLEDGRAMIRAAEAAGRVLMVGHNMRFGTAARRAKQTVEAGWLGEIVSAEIHFSSDTIKRLSADAWRLHLDQCPLLPVMQLGIHAIDLMHYLIGDIREVYAAARPVLAPEGVVDSVAGTLHFEDGPLGTMVSNYCTPVLFEYRIAGTEGLMRCTPHSYEFQSTVPPNGQAEASTDEQDYSGEGMASYTRQMQAFGAAVREGTSPEVDGWAGLQALAVTVALQRSVETGVPQAVPAMGARTEPADPENHAAT